MKIIIAGSRECTDYKIVDDAVNKALKEFNIKIKDIKEIVSGGARGVDQVGEEWAKRHGVNCIRFPADWSNIKAKNAIIKYKINPRTKKEEAYNANAGFERNEKMAEYADALIAIDLDTNGTNHMIKTAKLKKLKVYQHTPHPIEDHEFFKF